MITDSELVSLFFISSILSSAHPAVFANDQNNSIPTIPTITTNQINTVLIQSFLSANDNKKEDQTSQTEYSISKC